LNILASCDESREYRICLLSESDYIFFLFFEFKESYCGRAGFEQMS
jgi:hypothetical protein